MRLWVFAVRRLAIFVPVLLGFLTITFVFVSALPTQQRTCAFYPPSGHLDACAPTIPCPGQPDLVCPNPVYEQAVVALGLNQSIVVQWAIYMGNALTFNWGYITPTSTLGLGIAGLPELAGQSVTSVIGAFAPYSAELVFLALVIALPIVYLLERRRETRGPGSKDRGAFTLSIAGYCVPVFLLAILLLNGAVWLLGGPTAGSRICSGSSVFLDFYGSWPPPPCTALYGTTGLPPSGLPSWLNYGYHSTPTGYPTIDAALHGQYALAADTVGRMMLPALLLAFVAISASMRFLRVPRDPPPADDPRPTAVGRTRDAGPAPRRAAAVATLTALVPALLALITGAIVVELIFDLWGLGFLFDVSVVGPQPLYADPALLIGILLLTAWVVLIVGVVGDVLAAALDPRFRLSLRRRRSSRDAPEPADAAQSTHD